MTNRLRTLGMLTAAAALTATAATAQPADRADRKDFQIWNDVATSVERYTQFTVFDDVSASVENGVVTLQGKVTMPYKQHDIAKRVAKIDGVKSVRDQITVLPVSQFDDELRYRIARSIYNNSNFWNYAIMPNPPIHIVVEHGRVTLTGVVQNEVDRMLARSLATQFGALSVTNALKTDAEVRDSLEKIGH
jgi:hyperosmotically inducible periplasmic protein